MIGRIFVLVLNMLILPFYVKAQPPIYATVDSLNEIASQAFDRNYPDAAMLAREATRISGRYNYTKGYITGTCISSIVKTNINKGNEAIAALNAVAPLAHKTGDPLVSMKLYTALGICWVTSGNYDSARLYYNKALGYYLTSRKQSVSATDLYTLLGKLYIKTGNPEQAFEYYRKSLDVYKSHPSGAGMAWAQDLMGEVFYAQRLYEKALKSYDESYQAFERLDNNRGQAAAAVHKGNVYFMQLQDDSAGAYYQLGLKHYADLADSNGMAICYSNLSRIALEYRNTGKAIDYAHKALQIVQAGGYSALEASTYQQLGDIYGELGQYDTAIRYVMQAMAAARATDNKVIVKDCYKSLSELYEAMKQPEPALKNLLAAYRLKDSIQPVQFTRQLAEMQAKYETEKKEADLKLSTLQLQKLRYFLFMLVVVIVVAGVAVYYFLSRQKLLERLRKQDIIRETEETERQRIAKDIHDELGSGLSKIRFLSELADSKAIAGSQLRSSLHTISDTSRGLIDNMRDLIWAMNPENTTLDNLIARIREYSYDYLEDFPVDISFDIPEDVPHWKISKEVDRNVFMIVKEVLQNTVKHAQARMVSIRIKPGQRFWLEITDDGIGYDGNRNPEGNGLKNIEARGRALGAALKMTSCPGKGSSVTLEFDLAVMELT